MKTKTNKITAEFSNSITWNAIDVEIVLNGLVLTLNLPQVTPTRINLSDCRMVLVGDRYQIYTGETQRMSDDDLLESNYCGNILYVGEISAALYDYCQKHTPVAL